MSNDENEDDLDVEEEVEEEEDLNPLRDIHKLFPKLRNPGNHQVLEHGGHRLLSTCVSAHKNVICKQCGNAFKGGSFVNHIKQKRCLQGLPRMGKLVDVESPKKTLKKTPKTKKAGEAKAKESAKPKTKTADSITFPAVFLRTIAPKVKRWTDPKAIFVLQRGEEWFYCIDPKIAKHVKWLCVEAGCNRPVSLQGWPQHLARHHNNAEYHIIELHTHVVKTDDLVDLDKKIAAVRAKKAAKESEENEKAAKESEESEESEEEEEDEPRDRKKVR